MRVYVSGPITSREKAGESLAAIREDFDLAADLLKKNGHDPVNPFTLHDQAGTWEECLRADIAGLVTCNAIFLLPRAYESKGAMLELHIATRLGMAVMGETEQTKTILQTAQSLVYGERNSDYGHPMDDYTRTARMQEPIIEEYVCRALEGTTYQVLGETNERRDLGEMVRESLRPGWFPPEGSALCMVQVKASREVNKHKDDNTTDGAGYFAVVQRIHDRRNGLE